MTIPRITDDNLIRFLALGGICLTALLSIVGWVVVSGRFAAGVAVGGCLALLNFLWLRNALEQVLQMSRQAATRSATVRYLMRLSAMGFVLWFLIVQAKVHVMGLLVGLSVLVISIVIMTIYKLLQMGG